MKKTLTFFLALCMIFSLCACGQQAASSAPAEPAVSRQPETELSEETEPALKEINTQILLESDDAMINDKQLQYYRCKP